MNSHGHSLFKKHFLNEKVNLGDLLGWDVVRGGGTVTYTAHQPTASWACASGQWGAGLCREGQSANERLQPASHWVFFIDLPR